LLFNFPLTVRFRGKSGQSDQTIKVKEKEETFYFPLDSAPEIVPTGPEPDFAGEDDVQRADADALQTTGQPG